MDQKGKVARAARAEYPDLPGLLGNRPMSVIQTPWNSNSISYWTHNESSVIGYRYAFRTHLSALTDIDTDFETGGTRVSSPITGTGLLHSSRVETRRA